MSNEIEHAEALANVLEQSEETTLGPTDSAIVIKALRQYAESLRSKAPDTTE
jgi:hypothetical protein